MTAIALVGADGAGKTTLAEALVDQFPGRVVYLYMGANAASSNIALPSTRLVYALKVRLERKARRERGDSSNEPISLHGIEHRRDTRGSLWAAARLVNRIAEETMRQIVSWFHQARGSLVIYDRHFLFDSSSAGGPKRRLSERIHIWFLEHIYPKPHLVLFLDAPADVLYSRKQEVPKDYLENRRRAFLARGSSMPEFVALDASRPAEVVYEEAARHIAALLESRAKRFKRPRLWEARGGRGEGRSNNVPVVAGASPALSKDDEEPGPEIVISESGDAAEWDEFLAATEGGHHVQTAAWARVKGIVGWRAVRLIATADGRIVGGAQLLWRPVPVIGAIGYVPKGPVLSVDAASIRKRLVGSLVEEARRRRINHLTIQPPSGGEALVDELEAQGFRHSSVPVAPVSTTVIDLRPDFEELTARLSRKTRYNVGVGGRKGVCIREGTEDDIVAYYDVLSATAARQGFATYPISYFVEMWRQLEPPGNLKMFVAEYRGEVVSAQLIVPFGDTVVNKLSVWSGRHGSRRPNELLQWHAIEWSKRNGFRFYDFEGIDERAVEALQRREPIPEDLKQTVTSFKLGFGGDAVRYPPALSLVRSRALRWGYETVFPRISGSGLARRAVNRFRVGLGSGKPSGS